MTIYEKTQKIFREAEEKQRIEWENDTDSLREQTLISDEACAMARMQLPHFSQNYKKYQ